MKTSLSPIALAALLVGPGLTAWARQDAPAPTAPPAPSAAEVNVPVVTGIPLLSGTFARKADVQDPSDEERALQDKVRALEQRAAELEAVLRDRLDATEAQAVQRGVLKELMNSEEKYLDLEARVKDHLLRVDPERGELREVVVRDLLDAAPARIAEIQDEKVRAKVLEAMERAKAQLEQQRYVRANEFQARAEEMRALAEAKRAEAEARGYQRAHARYRLLQEEAAALEGNAEEIARAEMRARRAEGAVRREQQEISEAQQAAERDRREVENVRRRLEQELAKREVQRRTEETRLRTELDAERARLAEMRAKLEQAHAEMRRNVPRAEPPRPDDLWVQHAAPRAEPPRPASSDVTIIVEQGDVHVHAGGGATQVIAPATKAPPRNNIYFGEYLPMPPTPPVPPKAAPSAPDHGGTTQAPGAAPGAVRYWSTAVESLDPAQFRVQEGYAGGYFKVELSPDTAVGFPAEYHFEALPELNLELPAVEIDDVDFWFESPDEVEVAPECDELLEVEEEVGFFETPPDAPGELELSGGVVVHGDGREVRADSMLLRLAANPAERAPSQDELLARILRLSEELKAEVGALRSELLVLRNEVRDAPRR